MVAAVSPADVHYGLTLSTLRYANQAKQMQTRAVVNKDPKQKLISELRGEISQLREQLRATAAPTAPLSGDSNASAGGWNGSGGVRERGTGSSGEALGLPSERGVVDELRDVQGVLAEFEMTVGDKRRRAREIASQRREVLGGDDPLEDGERQESVAALPFLVNLSEDALLAESLVYRLRPGRTRVFRADVEGSDENELIAACDPSLPRGGGGSGGDVTSGDSGPDASHPALVDVPGDAYTIRLDGIGIAPFHCVITNGGGQCAVLACEGADVFVNGSPCEPGVAVRLRHNSRIVLGSSHFFRYTEPAVVAQRRHRRRSQPPPADLAATSLHPRDQIQRMRERRRGKQAASREGQVEEWPVPESPVTGREGSVSFDHTQVGSPDSGSVTGADADERGEGDSVADSASVGDCEVTYEMAARELALGRMRRRSGPTHKLGSAHVLGRAGDAPRRWSATHGSGGGAGAGPGERGALTRGGGPTRHPRLASLAKTKWQKLHSQTELEDRLVRAVQLIGEAEEIATDLGEEVSACCTVCPRCIAS